MKKILFLFLIISMSCRYPKRILVIILMIQSVYLNGEEIAKLSGMEMAYDNKSL